ncbi:MAG: hypothetical protein VX278_11480, partial [Myxococcota bacterium]|nr:hypothetical protein [Myxococcota bacterium]
EPKSLYPDSWVAFLSRQHKLNHTEKILWEHHKDWFVMLEQSPMTKSYKMVSLLIILAAQKLQSGMQLTPFIQACRDFIYRDPLLRNDAIQVLGNNVEPRRWQRYWIHWLSTSWKRGREWLQLRHDRVCIDVQVIPALKESFTELSMELIEYRLHRYRKRIQQTPVRFDTYLHIDGKGPYLQLPQSNAPLPIGNQKIRVPSGEEWIFEIAPQIRKAHPKGKEKNQLSLFLHTSKAPLGTRFRFSFLYDGWHLEILHAKNQRFLDRYEMERIDAWHDQRGLVHLPLRIPPSPLLFAIRSPTSLEGPTPIQKGDWLIVKWSNSAPQKHKLIIQNNQLTLLDASTETEYNVIASLEDHISPHELAPPPMTTVAQKKLAVHFGLSQSPPKGSSRIDGHLFLFLDKTAQFHSPETFSFPTSAYKNESAHVLLEQNEHVLYLGLARQEQARWHIEPLPWTCWKQFGGNAPHRTLPAVFLKQSVPVRQRVPSKGWVSIDGWQFQIVSKTPKGNIILRDKSGKEERINQTDIGWCLYAHDKLHRCTPSIHYIHNLRYLQGYRANAKQMRILRGAFACCFGEFHKKQRKESLDPVSFLLREFQSYKPKRGLSLQDPILQFTKQRILVFIQDCFLLGCPIHAAPQPQNMAAQEAQYEDLRSQGWKIITFWQHDLKKITLCKKRILKHIQSR